MSTDGDMITAATRLNNNVVDCRSKLEQVGKVQGLEIGNCDCASGAFMTLAMQNPGARDLALPASRLYSTWEVSEREPIVFYIQ